MPYSTQHFLAGKSQANQFWISADGLPEPDAFFSKDQLSDLKTVTAVLSPNIPGQQVSGNIIASGDGWKASLSYRNGAGALIEFIQAYVTELSGLFDYVMSNWDSFDTPSTGVPFSNEAVADYTTTPGPTQTALNAMIDAAVSNRQLSQPAYHLDAYANFFAGPWVAGQTNVSTTLTASSDVGATSLAVADGSAMPNGTVLLTGAGTAQQQQYVVTAGGGTNALTVSPAVTSALASGATVSPLWTNENHLTPDGYTAYSYWMMHWKKPDGTDLFTDPGDKPIVWWGDSWSVYGTAQWTAQVNAKFPSATAVVEGVVGNSSDMIIARWGDVPSDAAYVIFNEPGTNDLAHGNTRDVMAANLEIMVALIRSIGAVPVYTGMVPLFNFPQESALEAGFLRAQMADPVQFPATPLSTLDARYVPSRVPEPGSVLVGSGTAWLNTTGIRNVAVGFQALHSNTTGSSNCALGYNTLFGNTTGSNNTGFGYGALQNLVSGLNNTALGYGALQAHTGNYATAVGTNALNASTANFNTALGYNAGTSPNGVAANKTIAGLRVTAVGYAAGAVAGDPSQYVALGANATAGKNATALGTATVASGAGSVAIGMNSAGTAASATGQDYFVLGTATHKTFIPGLPTTDPHVAGQLWANAGVVTVSAG